MQHSRHGNLLSSFSQRADLAGFLYFKKKKKVPGGS